MSDATKAEKIRFTLKATRDKRKNQTCKTYELKIDSSHLSNEKKSILSRIFLEAKWFYNHILSQDDLWNQDYKIEKVRVKLKDGTFEDRDLQYLSSQVRQEIIDRTKDNIRGLSRAKSYGSAVGKLKFKSRIHSIPLKQYGNTYSIIDKKRIRIQNVGKLKVLGLDQIPRNAEPASAILEQRNGDYYLHVAAYSSEVEKTFQCSGIGIDFGIKNQLTLSNGIAVKEGAFITGKIKKLHEELSRRVYRSKNWYRTRQKLQKEYQKISNQRKDQRNKIVSALTSQYEKIGFQNDSIKGWMCMWGRKVQASAIGGIMSDLKRKTHTLIVIPRYIPTSQTCSRCGHRERISLSERIFNCEDCSLVMDRDLNAAINALNENVPVEYREVKPVDTKTNTELMDYLNRIPGVSASLVVETGSLRALA